MHSLPIFVRLEGRRVILIGAGEAADTKRRLLERAGAIVSDDTADVMLAFVATADQVEAETAAARLRARGILVNVADRPDLCDFTLPAIVDRDPVLVAIGTGGASAGLAKAIRQRLEALLPSGLGGLAGRLREARATMRERWPDAAARRHAIDAALSEGGALDPMADRSGDAVDRWLAGPADARTDRIETVYLHSPDPDELTLRVARLLGTADRIYHRPEVPAAILDRARADAARIACARPPAEAGPGLSVDLSMEPA